MFRNSCACALSFPRFQEQVKLLTRELNDAKTTAEEQKVRISSPFPERHTCMRKKSPVLKCCLHLQKDTQDASNLSARLLEVRKLSVISERLTSDICFVSSICALKLDKTRYQSRLAQNLGW